MKEAIQVGLTSTWTDFKNWSAADRTWLFVAMFAILLSTFMQKAPLIEVVTAVTNVMCVLLVAKGRLSSYYWGLIGTACMAYVAFEAKLYGTSILNVLFVFAQFWGWWEWYSSMRNTNSNGNDVSVRPLSTEKIVWIFAITGMVAGIVSSYFKLNTDNPFPTADALMLVFSIAGTVLMVKRCAEQWFFWIAANVMCIYMWVLPALDGAGSLPIVVMWIVFTINSIFGLYKWVFVRSNK